MPTACQFSPSAGRTGRFGATLFVTLVALSTIRDGHARGSSQREERSGLRTVGAQQKAANGRGKKQSCAPLARTLVAASGLGEQAPDTLESAADTSRAAGSMTDATRIKLDKVISAIRAGAGQGRGDAYQPWIRIRRNFSSPVSHQVLESVGINARNHHFLSTLEFKTGLLTSYLGLSHELREGLPLWPYEHPHPDADLSLTAIQPKRAPGLLDIAHAAGIKHGCYVGTKVPYIASIDLLHTLTLGNKRLLLGISCKPAQKVLDSERVRERLELERLYCESIGALHVIEYGLDFDETLIKHLSDYKPFTSQIRAYRGRQQLTDFAGYFEEHADEIPIREAVSVARTKVGLDAEMGFLFLRLAMWLHLVDIDLAQALKMGSPARRGSSRVLEQLRARYLGGLDG